MRYPEVQVFDYFRGHLDNAGEEIAVYDPQSNAVTAVTYDDIAPWPTSADGEGPSLESNGADEWHPSSTKGGTPGVVGQSIVSQEPFQLLATVDLNGAVLLEFNADDQRTHVVQYTETLDAPDAWQTLTEIKPTEPNSIQRLEDQPDPAVLMRYYRVVVP